MLGCQTRKKWNRTFENDNIFGSHLIWMKFSGVWPVDYTKFLPDSCQFLNRHLNFCYAYFVAFLNMHMIFFYSIRWWININREDATITEITDAHMSLVLQIIAFFGGYYLHWNHDRLAKIIDIINTKFKRRSAKGYI